MPTFAGTVSTSTIYFKNIKISELKLFVDFSTNWPLHFRFPYSRACDWLRILVRTAVLQLREIHSSAYVHTAELLSSRERPSDNLGFLETAPWIQAKCYGKLAIRHIYRLFFFLFFFKILHFQIFTFFFLFRWHGTLWMPKFQNGYFSHRFYQLLLSPISSVIIRLQPKFMINILVIGEYRLLLFWAICQTFKILWQFLLTQDNMGLEISKRHFAYSVYPILAKLYENIAYHGEIQTVTFRGNRPSLKVCGTLKF